MRRLVAVLALLGALVVVPQAAYAHDVLRSTDPADGSTVEVVPDQVVLTFDQPALAPGTAVVVRAEDGRDVAVGAPVLVDTTVRQQVGGTLPAGHYTVLWRVTSADGHPIDGTFTFTARSARTSTAAPSAEPPQSSPPGDAFPLGATVIALVVVAAMVVAYAVTRTSRRR